MMSDIKPEILSDNSDTTINSQQVETLKKHFPQCFDKDGNFMPEKLNDIISANGTSFSKESYGLNWLGKSYARLLANENPLTLLAEDKNHNQKPENQNSENLLIKGDNLEVLKHLKGAYSESIKMIYIDPPYNTGSDGFVYQDDRKFTPEQLSELAGIDQDEAKRILEFTQSKANSHSAWLTFMYPRLYIARELLNDEGVIFISIDDNEFTQLKILCDEVFGEHCFVATIPWKKRTAKSDVPFGISQDCEWILCYAKQNFNAGLVNERKYFQTPDYPNDRWRTSDLTTQRSADERENSAFVMKNPKTGEEYPYNPKRVWSVTTDTFDKYYKEGRIVFPGDYDFLKISGPVWRVFESEDKKKALKKYGTEQAFKAVSTDLPSDVGMTKDGNKDIVELFGEKLFSFPKPVSLLKHIVKSINDKNALVLDFFSGSGTTAHSVMDLNKEDDGNRTFICVQLPELTEKNKAAYKAGYKTICDITKARIEKAAEKIRAENPDYSGDLGFKIFETLPIFEGYLDNIERLEGEQGQLFDGSTLSEEQLEHLLTTWKVYDGIPLTQPLSETDLAGYTAYRHDKVLYLMHQGFRTESLNAFLSKLDSTEGDDKTFDVEKLVLFGYNFDSKHQLEINDAVRQYQNRKEKTVSVVVRY